MQQVVFRLFVMPCCGYGLCWINPYLPTYCPECGKRAISARRVEIPDSAIKHFVSVIASGRAQAVKEIRSYLLENMHYKISYSQARELVDQLTRDFSLSTSIFPLAWRINDSLKLTPDGGVEFTGSQNDVQAFRLMLHRLDPNFSHGED